MHDAQPWVYYGNFAKTDRVETYNRNSLYHGAVVYMGGDVAFERSFIEAYAADLISHSHSWRKTADSMNLRARNLNIVQVSPMSRRTTANVMLKFKLIEFDLGSGKKKCLCQMDCPLLAIGHGFNTLVFCRHSCFYGLVIEP